MYEQLPGPSFFVGRRKPREVFYGTLLDWEDMPRSPSDITTSTFTVPGFDFRHAYHFSPAIRLVFSYSFSLEGESRMVTRWAAHWTDISSAELNR